VPVEQDGAHGPSVLEYEGPEPVKTQ